MTESCDFHGNRFCAEIQGRGARDEADRQQVYRRLWGYLGSMSPATIAKLHADMMTTEDEIDRAYRLGRAAVNAVTRHWKCGRHVDIDFWCTLSAVPAPTAEQLAAEAERAARRRALNGEFSAWMHTRPSGHGRVDWQRRFWDPRGL